MDQTTVTRAVPVDWKTNLGTELQAARSTSNTGHTVVPQGFTPDATGNLLVGVQVDTATGTDAEIWTSQRSGRNGRRLVSEPQSYIHTITGSPNNSYVAYTAVPHTAPDSAASRLAVVHIPTGRKFVITQQGAAQPQWSEDGNTLFFFQTTGGKWQSFRATSLQNDPRVEAASTLLFDAPGAFSPNGTSVAGIANGKFAVETLATHQRQTHSFINEAESHGVAWSPDSQWVVLHLRPISGIVRNAETVVYNPSTDKMVSLDAALHGQEESALAEGADVGEEVASFTWIPGPGHRLLLGVKSGVALSCVAVGRQAKQKPQSMRWLIYDVDTARQTLLPQLQGEKPGGLHISQDRRALLIGDRLFNLDAPL